jgi:predicted aldo/keto reductase-like oxidoreductase
MMTLPVLWGLWPSERLLSWGYVTDNVQSAKNCVQCGECEEKCPYDLPIREMMVEHVEFYENMKVQASRA